MLIRKQAYFYIACEVREESRPKVLQGVTFDTDQSFFKKEDWLERLTDLIKNKKGLSANAEIFITSINRVA